MGVNFTLNKDTGNLEWGSRYDSPDLSHEEARIIAEAEKAEALRFLGSVMSGLVEEVREAHLKMPRSD